jgi:hypothetical protein
MRVSTVGALPLLFALTVPLLACWRIAPLLRLHPSSGRRSSFEAVDVLLAARTSKRVLILHLPGDNEAEELCLLAQRNGEFTSSDCRLPKAQAVCSNFSFLLSEHSATEDAEALHVLVLPEPRAYRLSLLLPLLSQPPPGWLSAEGDASPPSLAELLTALASGAGPARLRDNPAVRFLAGAAARRVPTGKLEGGHLSTALTRLAAYDFVLLPGAFQQKVPLLAQRLGWRYWDVTHSDRRKGITCSQRELAASKALESLGLRERAALQRLAWMDEQLLARVTGGHEWVGVGAADAARRERRE